MKYMCIEEICERYKISRTSFWRLRKEETFPIPIKIMGKDLWEVEELESWEAEQVNAA